MFNIFQNSKIISGILIFIAIGIQIQVTVFQSENYNGLRINLVDFTLPFLGLWIGIGILLKKTKLPEFNIKHPLLWPTVLFATLCLACLHSHLLYQELNNWALLNKTIGFLILISYFLLGGWLGNNVSKKQILTFLQIFSLFFCLFLIIQSIDYILFYTGYSSNFLTNEFPASGLSANKNTYVFLYFLILSLISLVDLENKHQSIFVFIIWAFVPLTYLFTGARAALIVAILLFPLLFVLSKVETRKLIAICALIGFILAGIFNANKILYPTSYQSQNYEIVNKAFKLQIDDTSINEVSHAGDELRLKVLRDTLQMIQENPVLGSGLGSIMRQNIDPNFPGMIMDSTPLWLWAETGIIGLVIFLSFYFICLRQFWINGFKDKGDPTTSQLNQFAFCMMLIFSVMCLFHELLYTRFLWFFMGLTLAYNVKPSLHVKKKYDGDQTTLARD